MVELHGQETVDGMAVIYLMVLMIIFNSDFLFLVLKYKITEQHGVCGLKQQTHLKYIMLYLHKQLMEQEVLKDMEVCE